MRRNRQRDAELQELAATIEENTNCTRRQALAAAQKHYPLHRIIPNRQSSTKEQRNG